MFNKSTHSAHKVFAQLILAGSFFCVLFGQGLHFHEIALHFGDHFDAHVHIHAHESPEDQPFQAEDGHNNHQHEVSTANDIIGTLISSYQVSPDIQSFIALGLDNGSEAFNLRLQQLPTLFDLPPPRPVSSQYHLSSFSHRGPPIA